MKEYINEETGSMLAHETEVRSWKLEVDNSEEPSNLN